MPLAHCHCAERIPRWHIHSPLQSFIFAPPGGPSRYSMEDDDICRVRMRHHHHTAGNSTADPPDLCYYLHHVYDPIVEAHDNEPPARLFLFFHGNGCDLFDIRPLLHQLVDRHARRYPHQRVHVVGMEYPGYGLESNRACDARVMREHSIHLLHHVMHKFHIESMQHVFLVGHSLGTGVASYVAAHTEQDHLDKRFGALILLAPFTTLRDVAKQFLANFYWLRWFYFERFDNTEHLRRLRRTPVYMVHGDADSVIPSAHSRQLRKLCLHVPRVKLYIVPGGSHAPEASEMAHWILHCATQTDPTQQRRRTRESRPSRRTIVNVPTEAVHCETAQEMTEGGEQARERRIEQAVVDHVHGDRSDE